MISAANFIRSSIVCSTIIFLIGIVASADAQIGISSTAITIGSGRELVLKDFESPVRPTAGPSEFAVSQLESLIQMEKLIQRMLPEVIPCVVAIEGGTGVIVSSDGYVLTASHIAKKPGRKIEVQLSDGRTVMATTLGINAKTDTAVVRLSSGGPWPFIEFNHRVTSSPGDWCVALGYPLSFPRGEPAAARLGRILETDDNLIVTDCPIMGGDSGGPLVSLNGELIGICSRIKPDITANLAIPVQTFQKDWNDLAASIDVRTNEHPAENEKVYLGVRGETDRELVRIQHVHSGSPAAVAGWQTDDVLLRLKGQALHSFEDVRRILDTSQPGDFLDARLNRFGTIIDLPVRLGSH